MLANTYAEEPTGEYRQQTTPVGQFPPMPSGCTICTAMSGSGAHDDFWHDNHDGAPRGWQCLHRKVRDA
jgi:hypothetical protein